ncbi:MAG: diaminopimelate decarboxylase [Eubacteriales bacterium]
MVTEKQKTATLSELPCPDLSVGEQGELCFAGQSTAALIKKYGTPLYLMNEDRIRLNCRRFLAAARAAFAPDVDVRIMYASKAASFMRMYRIMADEHMGADVVSSGEIYTANAAGFPMRDVFFHSNNKTDADIELAVKLGVGCIVADGEDEIRAVSRIAAAHGVRRRLLLRVTPGIDPHTFAAVTTGKVDSKFGCAIETGQAEAAARLALSLPGIKLAGFHCHVGSQIFDPDVFVRSAKIMAAFISDIRRSLGYEAECLDLGGGFGVPYTADARYPDVEAIMRSVAAVLGSICRTVCFEPGRAIVADAGMTLYTVGSVKRIPGCRSYVSVDGGMTDNPRFALYKAPYTLLCSDRPETLGTATGLFSVAGRCCESGDMLQHGVSLPADIRRGDHIACLTTGAYNYSMASNYNRIPRPPVVMLSQGENYVAVRRETYDDIIKNDV